MACFASRIPYGQILDEKKLQRIKEGEKFLKTTLNLEQLRVRHHENKLARIELLLNDLPKIMIKENFNIIITKFKELGFCYITLDLEGFRSGSMDEIITQNMD